MTDREERMLLSLLEAEVKNADMIAAKWESAPEADDADAREALEHERSFSRGFAVGAGSMLTTVRNAINA